MNPEIEPREINNLAEVLKLKYLHDYTLVSKWQLAHTPASGFVLKVEPGFGVLMGTKDGYILILGPSDSNQEGLTVYCRFKQTQPEKLVRARERLEYVAKFDNPSSHNDEGQRISYGTDYIIWYAFRSLATDPQVIDKAIDSFLNIIKTAAQPFDGKCEICNERLVSELSIRNGIPGFWCTVCQEELKNHFDQSKETLDQLKNVLSRYEGHMAAPETALRHSKQEILSAFENQNKRVKNGEMLLPEELDFLKAGRIELETFVPAAEAFQVQLLEDSANLPSEQRPHLSDADKDHARFVLRRIRLAQAKAAAAVCRVSAKEIAKELELDPVIIGKRIGVLRPGTRWYQPPVAWSAFGLLPYFVYLSYQLLTRGFSQDNFWQFWLFLVLGHLFVLLSILITRLIFRPVDAGCLTSAPSIPALFLFSAMSLGAMHFVYGQLVVPILPATKTYPWTGEHRRRWLPSCDSW